MGDGAQRAFGVVALAVVCLMSPSAAATAPESCYARQVIPPPSTERAGGGGVDGATISDEIRRRLSPIKKCYENATAFKDGRSGHVELRFEISPSGVVTKVRLASEPFDDAVADCIGRSACGWIFPPANRATIVARFPFVFQNQPDESELAARYLALPPTPLPGLPAVAIRQIAASLYVHESYDAQGVPSNGLVAVFGGRLLLVDTASRVTPIWQPGPRRCAKSPCATTRPWSCRVTARSSWATPRCDTRSICSRPGRRSDDPHSVPLEVLNLPLMLLRRLAAAERPQVAAFARLGIELA
jgi:hypothetical protein